LQVSQRVVSTRTKALSVVSQLKSAVLRDNLAGVITLHQNVQELLLEDFLDSILTTSSNKKL